MEKDDETVEMDELQEQQSPGDYKVLLRLMDNRQLATFKSLLRRGLKRRPPTIDVNRVMDHPVSMSFLDKAAREDLGEFVAFLLEVGADPNRVNNDHDRAPIHFAAEEGNAEALAALLRHQPINPNLLAGQMTALHFAVKANCEICVRLLLDAGASPNIPNSKGITALHFAAEKQNRGMVQLILDHSKILDLDTYRDRRKETARTLIEKNFPDIKLPAESDRPDDASLLRYYLTANDEANFAAKLSEVKDLGGAEILAELLKLSVERNFVKGTDALLERSGAESVSLPELAKLAIERAHHSVLKRLLRRMPRMADELLLPASQELGTPASSSTGSSQDRVNIVKLLLSQPDIDVRQEDDKGNSPLHYAARAECREAIELLLQKGSYLGHMNNFGTPPLAHIAPSIVEEHLDGCLSSSNERTEEYEVIMDYENLAPHDTECGANDDYLVERRRAHSHRHRRRQGRGSSRASPAADAAANPCSETEALLYVADSKAHRHLLKHPILASFLYLKYLRIRHVLYVNFLLYLLFYSILVAYIWIITSDAPDLQPQGEERSTTNGTSAAADESEEVAAAAAADTASDNWEKHPALSALLAVSLVYLVLRESLQCASSPLHYLASPDNWLEIGIIGLTLALLCGAGREIGALGILLSTWELVILIGQHPRMSTAMEMFKTVTVNFAKFFFLYVFLIVAFAFAFFVLFKGDDNFPNPLGSLFKTIVMLTGEFDSGDLPFVTYPLLSRVIFIGFIFLVVLILLNLLNGLAVNDTGEILSEAELVCLTSRARLVAYAERMLLGGGPLSSSGSSSLFSFACLGPSRLAGLARAPVRFVARRVLLFPRYLPHKRISVKPLKAYEITLHGYTRTASRCSTLTMDPIVVQRAKQILDDRDRQSVEDVIRTFDARFERLENAIAQMHHSLGIVQSKRPTSTSLQTDSFFEATS